MPADDGGLAIELSHVSVSFGAVAALREIDLKIDRGEAVALLGPSGCGKTTLLRAITGAVRAKGHRRLSGDVGIVYQDLKLLPWLTVADNVLLARRDYRGGRADAERLLERVGLGSKTRAYPYQLSGGQRQRVALARALFDGADILLLDEPFSALDFLAKDRLVMAIRSLQRNQRFTMIMVTHDLDDALALANRLVVLREGRIVGDLDRQALEAVGRDAARSMVLNLYGDNADVGTA